MRVLDMVVFALVGILILVSLLNPGGLMLAAILGILIISVRYLFPWLGEYVVSSHSGKKGRMKAQQARQSSNSGSSTDTRSQGGDH